MDFGNAAMMASIIMGLASVPFIASETGAFSPTASIFQTIPGADEAQETTMSGEMTETYGPDGLTKEFKLPFGKFKYTLSSETITQELTRPDRKVTVEQTPYETIWFLQSRDGTIEVKQTAEKTIETCKTQDGTLIKKMVSGTVTNNAKGNMIALEEGCSKLKELLQTDVELMESMKTSSKMNGNLIINEFVSDPNTGEKEWIEIYNPSSSTVSLDGWTIEDSDSGPNSLDGLAILSGGHLVLIKGQDFSFALINGGDTITLKNEDDTIDTMTYGTSEIPAPVDGQSTGRETDGGDIWAVFETPTPGASNE